MIYADPRTEDTISELPVYLKEARDAKWYRRLKIIQLSMTHMTVPQLAERLDVCTATVRNDIKAYNEDGIEGLKPPKSHGRPPKLGSLGRDDWSDIRCRTPNQYEQ